MGASMIRNTNEMLKNKLSYRRPSIQKQWSVDYDLSRQKAVNFKASGRPQLLHQHDISPQHSSSCDTKLVIRNKSPDGRMSDEQTTASGSDERFKFKIFLTQNSNMVTNTETESTRESINVSSMNEGSSARSAMKAAANSVQNEGSRKTAENRRALYRASRENAISLGAQPRLVRAMSAPLRSIDAESNPWLIKRRSRAKRNDALFFDRPVCKDDRANNIRSRSKLTFKGNGEIANCDIVTLVSLLSPGASDSEKEDTNQAKTEQTNSRRIEKSVSFQDSNVVTVDVAQSMIRRASIAPLAAKIRSNRPPTAPPGSIYLKNREASGSSIPNATIAPAKMSNHVLPKYTGESTDHASYPEYVRSDKEKECWVLYKKIAEKGILITYETILRGMLTPSEVRVIETKQKDYIQRQASIDT